MEAIRSIKRGLQDALRLVFPSYCLICSRRLEQGERHLCASCFSDLPRTNIRGRQGNVVERMFWGKVPIERASAYLYYHAGSDARKPLLSLKYYDNPAVGVSFGRIMAAELAPTGFFEGIDLIVPLPLARSKERRRGYNQSERLARGISEVTGLRVERRAVRRVVANPTQTNLTHEERRLNVEGVFALHDAERIEGKHLLLVDDVITSGATSLSCARELCKARGVRLSVLALALAGSHHMQFYGDEAEREERARNARKHSANHST